MSDRFHFPHAAFPAASLHPEQARPSDSERPDARPESDQLSMMAALAAAETGMTYGKALGQLGGGLGGRASWCSWLPLHRLAEVALEHIDYLPSRKPMRKEMPDALDEARAMDLPAAAIASLARRCAILPPEAEVAAARFVRDLRAAGWIARPLVGGEGIGAPELPVDPRVARALQSLAMLFALHLQWPVRCEGESDAVLEHVAKLARAIVE